MKTPKPIPIFACMLRPSSSSSSSSSSSPPASSPLGVVEGVDERLDEEGVRVLPASVPVSASVSVEGSDGVSSKLQLV